jgi:hypothetical protein
MADDNDNNVIKLDENVKRQIRKLLNYRAKLEAAHDKLRDKTFELRKLMAYTDTQLAYLRRKLKKIDDASH